jgi:hypothetical protein
MKFIKSPTVKHLGNFTRKTLGLRRVNLEKLNLHSVIPYPHILWLVISYKLKTDIMEIL